MRRFLEEMLFRRHCFNFKAAYFFRVKFISTGTVEVENMSNELYFFRGLEIRAPLLTLLKFRNPKPSSGETINIFITAIYRSNIDEN